jgi:hypothetical protein
MDYQPRPVAFDELCRSVRGVQVKFGASPLVDRISAFAKRGDNRAAQAAAGARHRYGSRDRVRNRSAQAHASTD